MNYKYNGTCKYCGYNHARWKNLCMACGLRKSIWLRVLWDLGFLNLKDELMK